MRGQLRTEWHPECTVYITIKPLANRDRVVSQLFLKQSLRLVEHKQVFFHQLFRQFRLFLYLIVPFWYASAAYQASLVEPKYPWRDQTSLVCCRSVPKKVRLGIYRTQIRRKTRPYFFSYRDQSGVLVIWRVNREKNSASQQTAAKYCE